MPAFYRATLADFIVASDHELLGTLSLAHAEDGFESQLSDATKTWFADVKRLQKSLGELGRSDGRCLSWSVLLEFVIPRKKKRIDVVILATDNIFLLEQKSGSPSQEDVRQTEEYALLLHYFHRPSDRRKIIPLLLSPNAPDCPVNRQQELALTDTAAYWISPVLQVSWSRLAETLRSYPGVRETLEIDPELWDQGEYFPVPSIIEAARTLQSGLAIREIAHSRAARHDIEDLTETIKALVAEAREQKQFIICFVTGVPGSGKTLVGLNLAFSSRSDGDTLNFMSGNGPLVSVLQALFYGQLNAVEKLPAVEARTRAEALIEDVHLFAKTYTKTTPLAVPSNHVVIFDEAQRAWDHEHSYRKFGRETSEPEMFLRIMERRDDWAVIIALVGGGQEINDGEAGLGEWGKALSETHRKPWRVIASPEVLAGGDSVAGSTLLSDQSARTLSVHEDRRLHLTVSVRSLKAENYSRWVNCVIRGEATAAAALNTGDFPVYLTRSLATLRDALRRQIVGESRCGLVGSSKAARLRAEGLEPDGSFHGGYRWDRWYLAPGGDVRSSSQLEVYATEFEIQGLELDWIGLCWGGDLVWSSNEKRWVTRKFRNADRSCWTRLAKLSQQEYRLNSYRVLLTRARQGLILFVPEGSIEDPTRDPREFDDTAAFLLQCGARSLDGEVSLEATAPMSLQTLF